MSFQNELDLNSTIKIRNKTYTIDRKIGEGAFGTIYLAEQSGQAVVLKVARYYQNNQFNFCIFNEISFLSELENDRIIKLLDYDYFPESIFRSLLNPKKK